MSNEVQVEINGLGELKDAFDNLGNAMTRVEEMSDVLTPAAAALREEIVQAAPRRTGFLSEHISISKPKEYRDGSVRLRVKPSNSKYPKDENGNRRKVVGAMVGKRGKLATKLYDLTAAMTARFAEFGTSKELRHPFITAAYESSKGSLIALISERLKAKLERLQSGGASSFGSGEDSGE